MFADSSACYLIVLQFVLFHCPCHDRIDKNDLHPGEVMIWHKTINSLIICEKFMQLSFGLCSSVKTVSYRAMMSKGMLELRYVASTVLLLKGQLICQRRKMHRCWQRYDDVLYYSPNISLVICFVVCVATQLFNILKPEIWYASKVSVFNEFLKITISRYSLW